MFPVRTHFYSTRISFRMLPALSLFCYRFLLCRVTLWSEPLWFFPVLSSSIKSRVVCRVKNKKVVSSGLVFIVTISFFRCVYDSFRYLALYLAQNARPRLSYDERISTRVHSQTSVQRSYLRTTSRKEVSYHLSPILYRLRVLGTSLRRSAQWFGLLKPFRTRNCACIFLLFALSNKQAYYLEPTARGFSLQLHHPPDE